MILLCAWVLWALSVPNAADLAKGLQHVPVAPQAVDAYDRQRDCWKGVEVRERPLNGVRQTAIRYTCWPAGHRP